MLEAFLAKAREAGGPELAHARVRTRPPGVSEEQSGAVVATARGLVFVVEELFDAGAATLIPREALRGVSRRDELWGAELTFDTSQGAWVFSRVEPGAVRPLLSALGLELATEDARVPTAETGPSPSPDRALSEPAEAAPRSGAGRASRDLATSPTTTNDAFAQPEFQNARILPPSANHLPNLDKPVPAPAAKKGAAGILLLAMAIAVVSVAATIVIAVVPSSSAPPGEKGPLGRVVELAADPEPELRTSKETYASSEPIDVFFHGFPGHAQDWITVVQKDAPTDSYDEWRYLDSRRAGMLSFGPLSPGTYEVRAFFDWPRGGYTIQHRVTVRVEDRNAAD